MSDPSLEEWLAGRPQVIRDLARSCPPDGAYRLSNDPDGDLYAVHSYHENGTLTVTRFTQLDDGQVMPLWNVFGVKPEHLVRTEEPPFIGGPRP